MAFQHPFAWFVMRSLILIFLSLTVALPAYCQTNVILIISDDAGFADFGFQGVSEVPTPRLDSLAQRGVRFTSAYTAAVCSPSRAAITTGAYQQRIGYEYNINNLEGPASPPDGLAPGVITIFERMQSVGYTTGVVGKWHLGARADTVDGGVVTVPGNRPPRQGVDEFFGLLKGSRDYSVGAVNDVGTLREMSLDTNGLEIDTIVEATYAGQYVTDVLGNAATNFIANHYQDASPFFLYVSFTAPHTPLNNSPDYNDSSITNFTGTRRQYASMMLTMDKAIGKILDRVSDPNNDGSTVDSIEDETLVIFINDNGGASVNASDNTPLRGFKGSAYEGGIRVPMLIAGAGVVPTNTTYDLPVHSIDILPTAFAIGGGVFGPGDLIDGVDLLPYVNGLNTNAPHPLLVLRSEDRIGLRKGDYKLVKPDRGQAWALYNIATDISEASNLAGANASLVEALKRDVTDFEVFARKPAHAALNNNITSINLNDRFVLSPPPPGGSSFVPDLILLDFDDGFSNGIHDASVRNGGFEEPPVGSGAQPDRNSFAETDFWTNIASANQSTAFVRTNLAHLTPQNAIISDAVTREAAVDTGHTLATGEQFAFSYQWRDAFDWNDAGDRVALTLYTTTNDAIGGPVLNTYSFLSALSVANDTYQLESGNFTAAAADNGRRLFLSLNGVDGGGANAGFCRVDDVYLARGMPGGPPGPTSVAWSDANVWRDADTGLPDTLLDLDAYANAVLEFPVTNGFSYLANNGMSRPTELEFMLNRIVLSGLFTDTTNRFATIYGKALLFVNSLESNPARISIDALNAGGVGAPVFSYEIANDLVLYNDLLIEGNGDVAIELSGAIRDYFTSKGLLKSGLSVVTLSGANTYSGITAISNGVLRLKSAGSLANSPEIIVEAGGVFDVSQVAGFTLGNQQTLKGNGTVVGTFVAEGIIEPGQSIGTLTFSNDLDLAGTTIIEVNRDLATNDVVRCTSSLTLGGALEVQNVGSALQPGDQFQLLSAAGYSGAFGALTPATPGSGLEWDTNNLAVNGTLAVLATLPTAGTNLTYSVSGGEVSLGWPSNYVGWILQMQTNGLDVGLQADPSAWNDVAGTEAVTSTNLPLDTTSGTMFFRLRFP